MSDFAAALSLADDVILLEVYAASEKPIAGVSSEVIAQSMTNGKYIPNFVEATDTVIEMAKPGDVIMTLGAGDVSSLGPIIVDGLTKRFASN
jgi:UDP-N-acetylmuramate--alanine ligase